MANSGVEEKKALLHELRRESKEVVADIEECYSKLIEEFDRRYPPVSRTEALRLSEESMARWLETRCQALE